MNRGAPITDRNLGGRVGDTKRVASAGIKPRVELGGADEKLERAPIGVARMFPGRGDGVTDRAMRLFDGDLIRQVAPSKPRAAHFHQC